MTTSQYEPVFEIFASSDLVNWRSIGHVFETRPSWADASFWAPELFYDNGTLYVFYTAHQSGGPLCVAAATSTSLVAPFAFVDHGPLVCQSDGSIDSSAVRDAATGALFLVWKEDSNSIGRATSIFVQQLNSGAGGALSLMGQPTAILTNDGGTWEGPLVEGPFIQYRVSDGFYYLFYSGSFCCGRGCNYALGVARSRSITSPFVKLGQPLISSNADFLCPGHGTVVVLRDGRHFLLHHAYVAANFTVGRQAVLSPLVWDVQGGWPRVDGGGVALLGDAPLPLKPIGGGGNGFSFSDQFASPSLRSSWSWPFDMPTPNVTLVASSLYLSSPSTDDLAVVLCQRARAATYTASAIVDLGSTTARATLVGFGDPQVSSFCLVWFFAIWCVTF